ncbi:MAG TPA: TetR family transcriptional regulator [Pseudonocardiaceae bacterium]|jgi:AcrR family transcriptional regulator|nr:TetR family transcriptional regulator [Pseudonocardiaceae bacterium]
MARWQPGAPERLQAAALKRFAEQGYDGTTVAEIAATAGLTERTFFRYFADKREVLFYGREAFERVFIDGIEKAEDGNALSIVAQALLRAGDFFGDDRRERSRARQAVIASDPSLQERELLKLSALAESMAGALRARGINATAATLAAESGVAAFRVAFTSWIADGERRSLAECQEEALVELRALLDPAS